MTYASDRLYNEVIRKKLAQYASLIKVKEILPHLPCLTLTDREDVETKKDSHGNYQAVQMLMDNLRRRENWPDEFIEALRMCEHYKLADELSVEYDRIRGRTNAAATVAPQSPPVQAPASDSTAAATAKVTTVTIHKVPVNTPLGLTPLSVDAPAQTVAPTNTAPQVPTLQVQDTRPEQVNIPAPAASPEPSEIAPPVVVSSQAHPPADISPSEVTSDVQENESRTHSAATGNQIPIINTPDVQTTISLTEGSAQASPTSTFQSQITNPDSTQSSQTPENSKVPLAVEETSDSLPVQETTPPLNKEPEECSNRTANEIAQRTNTAELPGTAQITTNRTAPATSSSHAGSINEEYFSKPGILQVQPPSVLTEEPCSTVSSDLEISERSSCAGRSGNGSFSTIIESPDLRVDSASQSLHQNIPPQHDAPSSTNQPEEDHYESLCQSQTGVLSNVIHFAEEPPAENLNGQPLSMLRNTDNPYGLSANSQHSMVTREDQPALNYGNNENVYPRKLSGQNAVRPSEHEKSPTFNHQGQESNASTSVNKREEGQTTGQINKVYLTAAAVLGIGLFCAWKIKH
ncbi:mitochondrial antiviral-signaling protein [Misgurnus anguillicaudatus]|uniref:mitochondrial antiviral-signaling protein n=1 Tax=Misgurnus anguillicaudatus TaxID=75329 RepID=UPI003CCFC130